MGEIKVPAVKDQIVPPVEFNAANLESDYIEGYGAGDFMIPSWKIVQSTSRVDAKPGMFWHTDLMIAQDQVRAIILSINYIRTYWGRLEISSDPPECFSLSASRNVSIKGDNCLACPRRNDAPWALSREERREVCSKGHLLFGLDIDNEYQIFRMNLGGISVPPMLRFTRLLLHPPYSGKPWKALTILSTEEKQTDMGVFYQIAPRVERVLTDNEWQGIKPLADSLRSTISAEHIIDEDDIVETKAQVVEAQPPAKTTIKPKATEQGTETRTTLEPPPEVIDDELEDLKI